MLDPFNFYARMVSATLDMAAIATRVSETLSASQEVIAKRSAMISEASRSPFDGNYGELGRMVPEKIEAFGKAGATIANDWWAMQAAAMSEAQKLGGLMMSGRLPTLADWSALVERNAAFGLRAYERAASSGARGLRPIHASATANARRLRRSKG